MALHYTEKVLEYFKNPKNVGEIPDADGRATEGSPACGDMITFTIKVKDGKITDAKFLSYGCASNIATASIVTELAKGKTIEEAKKIGWDAAAKKLGGLPTVKMHCSVLAVNALKAAIRNYEATHGLLKETEELTEEKVIEELKNVINPEKGVNIIELEMLQKVKITPDSITVKISLKGTDPLYSPNIEQEAKEHVESLPIGKREVKVEIK